MIRILLLLATLGMTQGCAAPVPAAGAGSTTPFTTGERRSSDAIADDESIQLKAQKRIADKHKDAVHANISAFNRFALITGSAASENVKMDIERIVGSIPNVKGVANELVAGDMTAAAMHDHDALVADSVKVRFARNKTLKTDPVKVITENGVVYLMGLVTRAEADAAAEIASTTKGVQKVVRVFEYLD